MNLGIFSRRNRLLLGLLFSGILFFFVSSLSAAYYKKHFEYPAFFLRINEVCTVNPGTLAGETLVYKDYIEIYNPSDRSVSLEHLFLSDDTANQALGPMPAETIPPKGYYVIYAEGPEGSAPEGSYNLPFRLSGDETLILSYCIENEDGSKSFLPVDSLYIPSMQAGAVYGRREDGEKGFAQMRPSPGVSNQTSTLVLDMPVLSAESGFYSEPFSLTMEAAGGLSIYYTLDGSEPQMDDLLYTEPLSLSDPSCLPDQYACRENITSELNGYLPPDAPVDKALVVRAAAYDADGNHSSIATASYFLNFEEKAGYENTAVISLAVDPADLFGGENGIYVRGSTYEQALERMEISDDLSWSQLMDYLNYYERGRSSERPMHVSFFDSAHRLSTQLNGGIRIRGNESRNFPQKSFTLFSRKCYEAEAFDPVLFDTGFSYPKLILNNSRQLKKVFFFSLVEDRNTAVQRYMPCQLFLNGEYWGMYYLMEKYSGSYLEQYYGAEADNILLIKASREVEEGEPEDISRLQELQEFLSQDMSDPGLYEELLTRIDMQSFIDWMCINIYIGNTDSKPLGGNVYIWQALTPADSEYQDGRWRWMLYDLDDSLGAGIEAEQPYAIDSFTDHPGYSPCGFLDDDPMPSLMGNADFRRQFVITFMDLANENFDSDRISAQLDELEARYSAPAYQSYLRWNTLSADVPFEQQIEELRSFFAGRYDAIVSYLAQHFSLTGALVPLTISADVPEGGTIELNTLSPDLTAGAWTGSYFTDYPLSLTATPNEGYAFAGWEAEGCQVLSDSLTDTSLRIQLEASASPSVKAVFTPIVPQRQTKNGE